MPNHDATDYVKRGQKTALHKTGGWTLHRRESLCFVTKTLTWFDLLMKDYKFPLVSTKILSK